MSMRAAPDGDREHLELKSERGASRTSSLAKEMPSTHAEEFRSALDGMTIEFSRKDSVAINPHLTETNLVRVIFRTEVIEAGNGQRISFGIIAANEAKPGEAYRLNPDEICLIQKFSAVQDHDVRITGTWDPKFHLLKFDGLHFGSRYVVAFTTDRSDVYAEASLPPVPGLARVG